MEIRAVNRNRRLEDEIRRLCAEAVETERPAELRGIVSELQAAIRRHADRIRKMAISAFESPREIPAERRTLDDFGNL